MWAVPCVAVSDPPSLRTSLLCFRPAAFLSVEYFIVVVIRYPMLPTSSNQASS